MGLCEVKVESPPGAADAVADALLEAGLDHWSVLEDAIAKRAWAIGIVADETEARRAWPAVETVLGAAGAARPLTPVFRELADADWRDSYKAHFRAWQFGRLHWVPVWERATFSLPPGDAVLWLDPGLAFGTGNHETTRLCVERLVALATEFGVQGSEFGVNETASRAGADDRNSQLPPSASDSPSIPNSKLSALRVIDAGCGSGILALSAARLGFKEVEGFDNDPEAVRISEENAALNGLTNHVRFFTGDLTTGLAGRQAEIVLANIQADVLIRFARELVGAVAPGGTLVLSGILAGENVAVREAFEVVADGWPFNARTMGEWSDVVMTRPG